MLCKKLSVYLKKLFDSQTNLKNRKSWVTNYGTFHLCRVVSNLFSMVKGRHKNFNVIDTEMDFFLLLAVGQERLNFGRGSEN